MSLVQEDRKGNNYVFVVKKEKTDTDIYHIEKQIITLGAEYQGKVLVKSGLQTNDLLAQQAARGLTEGEKVKLAKKVLEKNTKKNTEKSVTKNDNNFTYHIVEKGETLYRIHKKYHVSLQELKEWNQLKDNSVKEGEKLIVKK
jgi:LysM repeat protein